MLSLGRRLGLAHKGVVYFVAVGQALEGFRRGGLICADSGEVSQAAQNFERILPSVQNEIYLEGVIPKDRDS